MDTTQNIIDMNNENMLFGMSKKAFKKNGIIYCRLSRVPDSKYGILSLDSQEFAIKEFMKAHQIGIYGVLKNIGSAFRKPQTDLKNYLKGCKEKILIVYEANRLSRNLTNFRDIYNICKKNKHMIAIVNINQIFNCQQSCSYEILFYLIAKAEKESRDMGERISRTYQYKKSRETVWGKIRDDHDNIVDNERELKISRLILLLSNSGSSVSEISRLVLSLTTIENPEPFEIVEYTRNTTEDLKCATLPFEMSDDNIANTLNVYGIMHRRRKWNNFLIRSVINLPSTKKVRGRPDSSIDDLCTDFVNVLTPPVTPPPVSQSVPEWICVYYDPNIGLPPNVRVPENMQLPTTVCTIYLPKI